jgi:hypothetical protein
MELGPRQQVFRCSSGGTEIRLRVNAGDQSWCIIKRAGAPADYVDLEDKEVDAVVARFNAIGTDPAKFDAFVRNIQNGALTANPTHQNRAGNVLIERPRQ